MLNSAFDSPQKTRVRAAPTVGASTEIAAPAPPAKTDEGVSKQTIGIATLIGLSALGLLVLKPAPVPPALPKPSFGKEAA